MGEACGGGDSLRKGDPGVVLYPGVHSPKKKNIKIYKFEQVVRKIVGKYLPISDTCTSADAAREGNRSYDDGKIEYEQVHLMREGSVVAYQGETSGGGRRRTLHAA